MSWVGNGNFSRPSRKRQYGVFWRCQKTLTALRWGEGPLRRSEKGLREEPEEVIITDVAKSVR